MTRNSKKPTLIVIAVLLFVPYPTRISARTTVRVVRADGSKVRGIQFAQKWECYGLFGEGYDRRTTDQNGSVQFPSRRAYGTVASRILSRAFTIVNVHASYGARVWLDVTFKPPQLAVFPSPAFKPHEPFATSGTYVDGAGRQFFPQEDKDGQRILIDGDFNRDAEVLLTIQ